MGFAVSFGKYATASATLALVLTASGAPANASQAATPAPTSTAPKQEASNAPDFDPGLWKEVVVTHIWGPFTKHQTHRECWKTPTPQLTDKKLASKCRHVKIARKGNTYTVDEICPASGHDAHMHISRTYAGNTATESGTIKLKGLTAHVKAHAKRIGKCPATRKN